jgi:hypothetical protein
VDDASAVVRQNDQDEQGLEHHRRHDEEVDGDEAPQVVVEKDFLWSMSSVFFGRCRSCCRAIVAKWYCSSYGTWRSHRMKMIFTASHPMLGGPRDGSDRAPAARRSTPGPTRSSATRGGHLINHVPEGLVAGEAEVDDVLLAALHRHGHATGLRL